MPRKPKIAGRGDGIEYRFKIDAYSPDTMPMARLAQYMGELAALLGEQNAVHFRRVTKGSTVLNARIDREAAPKVRDRVASVRAGDAPGEPMRAFNMLNKFLRDDNAIGILRDTAPSGIIVRFPGREIAEEKFASIRQQGSIDGLVTGIRGKDDTIHITIQSEGQQISGCETNRTIAKQLGAKLFEPVRLFGRGRWSRDADGEWALQYFKIESFEALQDVSLTNALAALREIPAEWGDDAYSELEKLRHGPGGQRNGGH
ncbi:conserved hypothetical protein [Mesorhizobium metallidurans STM 2683]|uniref:Uncharacterized protein n=1 Tax=Mesorhizobium metallidurans STM 2683 TaxID=1297569 RepID=M5EJU3_9HYPH|nr:hypothetical protein [Mesorhizobium metallidurans]CCV04480.1 conserved hypothetical protein [Mesorhizobium metallidurans STM 2683]